MHFSPYNFCKVAVEAAERERSNPHEEDAGTGSGTGDVPRLRCTGGRNCLGVRAWRAHARFTFTDINGVSHTLSETLKEKEMVLIKPLGNVVWPV